MHLRQLIDHLRVRYGTPVETDRADDAYHWMIERGMGRAVHLCLTVEQSTRRASIWIFDSERPSEAQTLYLQVEGQAHVDEALRVIDAVCGASVSQK
jgi:hypothetical protein